MLSVTMRLTKEIRWSQVKSRDDAAEKLVSNEVKKALAEVTIARERIRTIERVIPDLRNTQNAKRGASNQRKAPGAGEANGIQQTEREG